MAICETYRNEEFVAKTPSLAQACLNWWREMNIILWWLMSSTLSFPATSFSVINGRNTRRECGEHRQQQQQLLWARMGFWQRPCNKANQRLAGGWFGFLIDAARLGAQNDPHELPGMLCGFVDVTAHWQLIARTTIHFAVFITHLFGETGMGGKFKSLCALIPPRGT